jgi:hypothetical protein
MHLVVIQFFKLWRKLLQITAHNLSEITAVGTPLQLTGAGYTYADFTGKRLLLLYLIKDNFRNVWYYCSNPNCRGKKQNEIVTVSVLTDCFWSILDQAYLQDATGAIAVLIKQFMVLVCSNDSDYSYRQQSSYNDQVQISAVSKLWLIMVYPPNHTTTYYYVEWDG